MNHRFVEAPGVRIHVVEAGPEDGPLVLLLHGFPEFWYAWRHQIEPLAAAGFRVWAPDQRGYGESARPSAVYEYRMDALVGDVVALLDVAGVERAAVVGHDWGGAVAWQIARRQPDRLRRVVILNAPHSRVMRRTLRSDPRQALRSWYGALFQLPWLPERLLGANDGRRLAHALRRTSRRGTFSDREMDRYREVWRQPGALRAMVNWYRAIRHRPAAPAPARVRVPTLLLWGARDAFLRSSMARDSLDLCDDGHLIEIEDATHWLHHERPERVTREILQFIQS